MHEPMTSDGGEVFMSGPMRTVCTYSFPESYLRDLPHIDILGVFDSWPHGTSSSGGLLSGNSAWGGDSIIHNDKVKQVAEID